MHPSSKDSEKKMEWDGCSGSAVHSGAFCLFTFRWIHYYDSNKSTGLETGKSLILLLYRHLVLWREVIMVEAYCFGEARHQGGGMMAMRFTVTVFIIRLFWSR